VDFRLFQQLSQETRHLAMMIDHRLASAKVTLRRLFPMRNSPCPAPRGHIIPLDALLVAGWRRRQIEQAIRKIVRNVHFEFLEKECAFRLLGPDMYYHALDPHLPAALARFDPPVALDDILSYRSLGDLFDLCLEDSWSGWLIAEQLRRAPQTEDLVIIHLDDHTDMMSTLLECTDEGELIEPSTLQRFDPEEPTAWETAILRGSIGIGCFVTPFYFGNWQTHVRHLNNAAVGTTAAARSRGVLRKPCSYELIPKKCFAAIRLGDLDDAASVGSYVLSSHCEELLATLPCGRVIVHVDLDYFINDLNGNPRDGMYISSLALIEKAQGKVDRFFEALHARRVNVDHWIIATSPGFCSACHWASLLNAFAKEIHGYHQRN
jgi:hypothetical protein